MFKISQKLVTMVQAFASTAVAILMFVFALFPVANLKLSPVYGETEDAFITVVEMAAMKEMEALSEEAIENDWDEEKTEAAMEDLEEKYAAMYEKIVLASMPADFDPEEWIPDEASANVVATSSEDEEGETFADLMDGLTESNCKNYAYSPSVFKLLFNVVDSAKVFGWVINAEMMATSESAESFARYAEKLSKLDYEKVSQESVDGAYFFSSLLSGLVGSGTIDAGSFITGIFSIIMIVMAMIFAPIVLAINGIKAAIALATNFNDYETLYAKTGKCFKGGLVALPFLLLLPAYYPSSSLSAGTSLILTLTIVMVAVNILVSRIKKHTKDEFMYLNILQGASLLGVIGFIIFAARVGSADLASFFNGDAILQLIDNGKIKTSDDKMKYQAIFGYGTLIMQIFFISVYMYFINILMRAACMDGDSKRGKNKDKDVPDAQITSAVIGFLSFLIPMIICPVLKIEMPDELKSAVIAYGVGTIICLLAEIAVPIVKKYLVPNLTVESEKAVRLGGGSATETGFVFEYLFKSETAAPVAEEVAATEEVAAEEVVEEPATETAETEEKSE